MDTVIFDMFGTLIDKEKYDYNSALKWLANKYFDDRFTELYDISVMFKAEYMKSRKKSYAETSFIEQLSLFEDKLSKKISDDYKQVELDFIRIFREEKIIDGVVDLLQYLNNKNQKIYVLTNSLFSGDSLMAYLKTFGIAQYIEKVYSSADIGFRKPSKTIFKHVLADLNIVFFDEVYFIGDSYEKDYVGASKNGLIPILIGEDIEVPGLSFDNMSMLLNFFRQRLD